MPQTTGIKISSQRRKGSTPAAISRAAITPSEAAPRSESIGDAERVIRGTTTVPAGPRPRYGCDVVIPYFRGLQWLPATIIATLEQSCVDIFVHLVNDCSPEEDDTIRREFAGEKRLRWYRNRANVGPYQSYHNVWSRLETENFAVQDADDLPLPNRLWRGLHALETTGTEIYGAAMEQVLSRCTNGDDWNEDYVKEKPFHESGVVGGLTPKGNLVNGTMVARQAVVEQLNGFASMFSCSCDIEFITRAHYAQRRFYIDSAVTGIRRVHGSSLSRGGEYRMGSEGRRRSLIEWRKRYAEYKQATDDFDFARFGCLDAADPNDCERVQ